MSNIKIIDYSILVKKIAELCIQTNNSVDANFLKLIKENIKKNSNIQSSHLLKLLLKNNDIAKKNKLPVCQDTGLSVFFVEMGESVRLSEKNIGEALTEGTASGYKKGYLRKSIVADPLKREPNTNDNSPPFYHIDFAPGNKLKVWFLPKGGGSENVSNIKFFNPTSDLSDISSYIVETIRNVGGKACPPYKLGVCIGGTFDYCAMYSKKILIDEFADKTVFANSFSNLLMNKINELEIGPQGLGGFPTVVKVNVKLLPTHIAMLPVAISFNCNAMRCGKIIL